MRVDEEGALAQLKAHRRDVLDPKITAYQGRIVRTATDGMIVEFLSVVDAVRCAADVQRCMADHIHMLEGLRKAGCEGSRGVQIGLDTDEGD